MAAKLRVGIPGAAGRMGTALIQAVAATPGLILGGAAEAPGSPAVGKDAGQMAGLAAAHVLIGDRLDRLVTTVDGVIDFTAPAVTCELCSACAERRIPLVIGTTGLSDGDRELIRVAATETAIVVAPNMSVGVNVLLRLAEEAVRLLGSGYDIEVVESHHRNKRDAPSGTALRLAEVLAAASAAHGDLAPPVPALEQRLRHGRSGDAGQRTASEIGVHAVRAGDIVGEHTVMLCTEGERVELIHRASSRQTFARGAVRALLFAAQQPAGLYDMQDVLRLKAPRR